MQAPSRERAFPPAGRRTQSLPATARGRCPISTCCAVGKRLRCPWSWPGRWLPSFETPASRASTCGPGERVWSRPLPIATLPLARRHRRLGAERRRPASAHGSARPAFAPPAAKTCRRVERTRCGRERGRGGKRGRPRPRGGAWPAARPSQCQPAIRHARRYGVRPSRPTQPTTRAAAWRPPWSGGAWLRSDGRAARAAWPHSR